MTIIVNGEARDLPEGTTVRRLIELLDLARTACAAEVNKSLIRHREHATHTLHEGDRVELVSLVGGG